MPPFDPDAYLAGKQGTPPAFDPDAYLAAKPAPSPVPAPTPAPVQSGQEGGGTEGEQPVPPVKGALPAVAPLPRERPSEAPRTMFEPKPTGPLPPVQDLNTLGTEDPGFSAGVDRSFIRGFHQARQSLNVASLGASARPLNNLTDIEKRLAAGQSPDDIPDNEDLFGARYMTPEQRTGLRKELEGNVQSAAKDIAARQYDISQLPQDPYVQKINEAAVKGFKESTAKGFESFFEEFKKAPMRYIANIGAESLPASAPSLVLGGVAGKVGGLLLGAAGAGAGSYATDYLASVTDALRDAKVNLSDPAAVEAAVKDPEFMKQIGEKAHAHAAGVAAFDAASLGVAGKSLLPKAIRPSNVVAEKIVEAPIQAPLQGALGAAGEATGQQMAGQKEMDWPSVIAEFFGEFAGTPMEVGAALQARKEHGGPVPTTPQSAPVTGEDIKTAAEKGVISVAPDEQYGPPKPPPPGGVGLTDVDGKPYVVATEPTAPPGTVPETLVPTGENGVVTTVKVTPGATEFSAQRRAEEAVSEPLGEPTLPEVTPPQGAIGPQPVEGFYSRLRSWVAEKGPSRLPANEWLAKVQNNNNFTREEANDLKLIDWLQNAGREKLTREDILTHVDSNAATLKEVVRRPLSEPEKQALLSEVEKRKAEVAARDPTAAAMPMLSNVIGAPPIPAYNDAHPEIAALNRAAAQVLDQTNWAAYQRYTTPGAREKYVEVTISTPDRLSTFQKAPFVRPEYDLHYDPEGDRKFPWVINMEGREFNRYTTEERARTDIEGEMLDREARHAKTQPTEMLGQHYRVPGEIVTFRATIRRTVDGQPMAVLEEVQGDIQQQAKAEREGTVQPYKSVYTPDLPMKDAWVALGVNRFLMWAAENNIRHIVWADSKEQMRRYPGGTPQEVAQRQRGMEHYYDKVIPSVMKKFAARVGGTMGTEVVSPPNYVIRQIRRDQFGVFDADQPGKAIMIGPTAEAAQEYIDRNSGDAARFNSLIIPQTGITYIEQGMPTYAAMIPTGNPNVTIDRKPGVPLDSQAITLAGALTELIKQFNIGIPIDIRLFNDTLYTTSVVRTGPNAGDVRNVRQPTWMGAFQQFRGRFQISLAVGKHTNAAQMWTTMVHELGHAISASIYASAPDSVKRAFDAAYDEYRTSFQNKDVTLRQLIERRYSAASVAHLEELGLNLDLTMKELTPKSRGYWMAKEEFFAEQVARWGTTKVKPLSVVEKFLSGISKKLLDIFRAAKVKFGFTFEPVAEFAEWLDSRVAGIPDLLQKVQAETENNGTVDNNTKMGPEELPPPKQPETDSGEDGINKLFDKKPPPPEVKETRTYADKMNWLYKWFLGVHQLAEKNPHIRSLAEYVETLSVAHLTKQQIMIRAQEVLKRWNRLGESQADAVSKMLDEVQYMRYRTPDEISRGVTRHPTIQELQDIAKRYGVTKAGFDTFVEVTKTFQEHLTRVENMLRAEANKITDQVRRDLANAKIDKQMAALRSKPYFPAMRFGSYTITIRDKAGKVIHFETFERQWRRNRAVQAIKAKYGVTDDQIQVGYMKKSVKPLLGVPTQLLELMADKLKMSKDQRDALEQLKFELSPAQSFQHRFQHKTFTAGYSQDFRRAYATYFFHGANHITKALHADRLRGLIKVAETELGKSGDVTKRDKIVEYMNDHIEHWLDPKSDWAAVRSIAFLWSLAFVPSAAAQNMSQTLMTSYPFLASKFGDRLAISALANAGRKFENFYRKGTYEKGVTSFEQRALLEGMNQGIIKETQAPELAGYADGNVLGLGFGGNLLQRGFVKFNEVGASLFELAEQVNRRLIFRATLDLALKNPQAKYVQEAVAKRRLLYDQMRANMTESEAAAYVTAVDATVTTQFQYGREYSPRVMRGKARSIFVFKTFIQSYVVFLTNYPQAAIRSLLIMSVLGGMMGVPFADDLKELLRAIAWRLFGKDFDLEQEGRKLVTQLLGSDENGREIAELVMHGIARKGYMIPHLMDMAGATVGIDVPMPTFDRSAAISAGTILPVELGKLFGPPTASSESVIAQQTQKASGAVFGAAFNIYKAIMNHKLEWDDAKRWERAVPRSIADVSKAYRVGTSGAETRSDGSKLVTYDVRDTQQMAEVFGMAAGYTPYRQTLERERDQALYDASKLWDIRRQDLMNQFGNAILGKDKEEIAKVRGAVRNFNKELPPEARGKAITSEGLEKSIENKATGRAMREHGLPPQKSDIPLQREVDKLYPESQRKLRPVPKAMTP